MKKLLAFILFLLLSCSMTAVAAEEADMSSYQSVIWDDADLLTDAEEQALYEAAVPLLPYGNVILYTTTLADNVNFEANAENTYYETFLSEPGVIFQIDMGNRKLTLSASTGMEALIGSERSSIVDNIYRYASDGDYYSCCLECLNEIDAVLNNRQIAHSMKYIDNALLAVILALVINFIIIFASSSSKKDLAKVLVKGSVFSAAITGATIAKGKKSRTYSPSSSGSSSGGGSSGGGGGGGFSGGSSSHGF